MNVVLEPLTDETLPQYLSLLRDADLPTEGVPPRLGEYRILQIDGVVVAGAGFEFYPPDALLRSVVVQKDRRSGGTGTALIHQMIGLARERKVRQIVLRTDTAAEFFVRMGFRHEEKDRLLNAGLLASPEFQHLCPFSAATMVLDLTPTNFSSIR